MATTIKTMASKLWFVAVTSLVLTAAAASRAPGYGLPKHQVSVPHNDLDDSSTSTADPFAEEWDTLDEELITEPSPHLMQSSLLQVPCGLQQQTDDLHLYSDETKINPVAAFVDTGAQVTVLSKRAAARAGLLHLMDRRYAGHATGVGQCRVLGRIPANALLIHMGDSVVPGPAITVLESTGTDGVDLLLGLDFLRDHHAVLSLHEEEMKLFCDTSTPVVIPFVRHHQKRSKRGPALLQDDCTGTNTKSHRRRHRHTTEREQAPTKDGANAMENNTSNENKENDDKAPTSYSTEQESEFSETDDFFGDVAFHERVDLSGV